VSLTALMERVHSDAAIPPEWNVILLMWLKTTNCNDNSELFTTHDEWTIVNYVKKVLRLFQHVTQWILKQHTVILHHIITV
jgi:hypothetical protein